MSSRQCTVPSNWNNNNIATRHQIRQEQVEAGVVSGSATAAAVNRSSHHHHHHHHHRNHVLNSNQQQLLPQIPSTATATATATTTTTTTTTPHLVVPMSESDCEVRELTWENGQLALHCLSGLIHSGPTKPTWSRASETLESIVLDPAASHKPYPNWHRDEPHHPPANLSFSRGGRWTDISSSDEGKPAPSFRNEPCQWEQNQCARNFSGNSSSFTTQQDEQKHYVDRSACASASASATICRENDTATITWASFESPGGFKTKTTEEVSACIGGGSENQEEDRETKTETVKSHTSRRSRVAAVHNQSERRRRNRINQKLKTLQKLVPNASKTDKASILDEVIDYLKQLQSQVQLMSMRNMPGMMMTLGMQQQLQMSLLARMGMGMMDTSTLAVRGGAPQCLPQLLHHPTSPAGAATFVPPPPFTVPSHMIPTQSVIQAGPEPAGTESASAALPDPFCTYLAQSMSMDFYNKMAALYQQQVNQTIQATSSSPSHSDYDVLQGHREGQGGMDIVGGL